MYYDTRTLILIATNALNEMNNSIVWSAFHCEGLFEEHFELCTELVAADISTVYSIILRYTRHRSLLDELTQRRHVKCLAQSVYVEAKNQASGSGALYCYNHKLLCPEAKSAIRLKSRRVSPRQSYGKRLFRHQKIIGRTVKSTHVFGYRLCL